jgi:hypothetical protein
MLWLEVHVHDLELWSWRARCGSRRAKAIFTRHPGGRGEPRPAPHRAGPQPEGTGLMPAGTAAVVESQGDVDAVDAGELADEDLDQGDELADGADW